MLQVVMPADGGDYSIDGYGPLLLQTNEHSVTPMH